MDAKKYFEIKNRMTKTCTIRCDVCPLCFKNNATPLGCGELEQKHTDEAIAIVEQWGKDNPIETYLTYAKKYFPKIDIHNVCIDFAYGTDTKCMHNCEDCWNQEYKK